MWRFRDNEEVGLEAAILQRKRNSSLVQKLRADDVTGLKHNTEALDVHVGFVPVYVVGER